MRNFLIAVLLLSFTAKAQTYYEIGPEQAKLVRQILDNRPAPEIFTEAEAWKVITEKGRSFQCPPVKTINYSFLHFVRQSTTKTYGFYREKGFWMTAGPNIVRGKKEFNWLFALLLIFSVIIAYFSHLELITRYVNRKHKNLIKFGTEGSLDYVFDKADLDARWKASYLPLFSFLGIAAAIMMNTDNFDSALLLPALIIIISAITVIVRIEYFKKTEETQQVSLPFRSSFV